jgi:hypothetical protein
MNKSYGSNLRLNSQLKGKHHQPQVSPNREPAGFLNRKYRTGIPVKPTGIPIGDFYQVW